MSEPTHHAPDPLLSATVYASGLLDDLIAGALVPFWQEVRQAPWEGRCGLWMVRYSLGGEHLKLRLHLEEPDRPVLARMLGARLGAYLAAVRDLPPASPRASRADAPAIDPEDEQPAPDRTFRWTTYRRSFVTLGSAPWIEDDAFVALATRCLARGCELVLAAAEAGAAGSPAARQKLALKALGSGLPALGLHDPSRAEAYLRYHRDWLLRFFLDEPEQERQALEHFDRQLGRMTATVEQLGRWLSGGPAVEGRPGEGAAWPSALAALADHLAAFEGDEDHRVDPFTTEVAFPPIFKVFHGLANQIGLRPLEEAYVHHLMATAVSGERPSGVPAAGRGELRSGSR